ncbi:DUF305 domain-containing protein [Pontibacter virosus]|uniref:Uncharacterized protein (DUF305 family) n=1 Tax=Pontibacter virosus TaxID=1765052 RepID=A0A2U1B4U5_9BACT|nr:DUF305 domain-containing protein [Pontibacter virosus]PVY43699.1 uncharacterized protein (DUF305 family) [Pontibacter virosus]
MEKINKQLPIKMLFIGVVLLLAACSQESKRAETATATDAKSDTRLGEDHTQHTMQGGEMAGMMAHMHRNMEEMQGMRSKVTGDPDYDFAQMMSMHHEGAIRMAEEEIANGTDSEMKEMAQKTKEMNQADIQKLQDFLGRHAPTAGDTTTTMRMMKPMKSMMDDMHQNMGRMNGKNTDQHFAQMMIYHHEMGNEMASEFLKMGKTQEMKQMAQKTINEQEKEIQELKSWLDQNKE